MSKPAHNRKDEAGSVYGKLTVISYARKEGKKAIWLCECTCGKRVEVSGGDLRRRDGKAIRACITCANTKHGHSPSTGQSPTYRSWHAMLTRCKRDPRYRHLTVHRKWIDFSGFLEDMGERPTLAHSIDRKDGTKGYEPGNCRWATKTEQARNMSSNVKVTLNGETLCLAEWFDKLNLSPMTYYTRTARGMAPVEALTADPYVRTEEHNHALSAAAKKALTEEQKEVVRTRHAAGETFQSLAGTFGVGTSTIARACGKKY